MRLLYQVYLSFLFGFHTKHPNFFSRMLVDRILSYISQLISEIQRFSHPCSSNHSVHYNLKWLQLRPRNKFSNKWTSSFDFIRMIPNKTLSNVFYDTTIHLEYNSPTLISIVFHVINRNLNGY